MQRFISRDPWESDKRIKPLWWLKEEDPCEYCIHRNSEMCEYCVYNKKKKAPLVY
jgi:hypothetical protein